LGKYTGSSGERNSEEGKGEGGTADILSLRQKKRNCHEVTRVESKRDGKEFARQKAKGGDSSRVHAARKGLWGGGGGLGGVGGGELWHAEKGGGGGGGGLP